MACLAEAATAAVVTGDWEVVASAARRARRRNGGWMASTVEQILLWRNARAVSTYGSVAKVKHTRTHTDFICGAKKDATTGTPLITAESDERSHRYERFRETLCP